MTQWWRFLSARQLHEATSYCLVEIEKRACYFFYLSQAIFKDACVGENAYINF
jgi:hypothetical protein